MGIATFPAAAGGGIKSVQRGLAASSGTVTITAVNTSKSFVNVFGTSSSGTVSVSGGIPATTITSNARTANNSNFNHTQDTANMNFPATTFTGGTTNLVAAVVQGYLQSSTELIVSGACRWEVVEFA
jgi:hypothetical protein